MLPNKNKTIILAEMAPHTILGYFLPQVKQFNSSTNGFPACTKHFCNFMKRKSVPQIQFQSLPW